MKEHRTGNRKLPRRSFNTYLDFQLIEIVCSFVHTQHLFCLKQTLEAHTYLSDYCRNTQGSQVAALRFQKAIGKPRSKPIYPGSRSHLDRLVYPARSEYKEGQS